MQSGICAFPNTRKAKGSKLQSRSISRPELGEETTARTQYFQFFRPKCWQQTFPPTLSVTWTLIQLLQQAQRRQRLTCRSFCVTPASPVPTLTMVGLDSSSWDFLNENKDVFLRDVLKKIPKQQNGSYWNQRKDKQDEILSKSMFQVWTVADHFCIINQDNGNTNGVASESDPSSCHWRRSRSPIPPFCHEYRVNLVCNTKRARKSLLATHLVTNLPKSSLEVATWQMKEGCGVTPWVR